MRPGIHLTRSLVFADSKGVDGAVGGLAALVGGTSGRLRRLQNGFVRSYALTMLAGVVVDPRCPVGDASDVELPLADHRSALIPLVGALVVAFAARERRRQGQADRARLLRRHARCSRIAAALQFKTSSSAQFQLAEQHAWIPQFGVSYAARRRRHRARADPHGRSC